jgi:hypothetical protein
MRAELNWRIDDPDESTDKSRHRINFKSIPTPRGCICRAPPWLRRAINALA